MKHNRIFLTAVFLAILAAFTVTVGAYTTTAVNAAPRPPRPATEATVGAGRPACTDTLYERTCERLRPAATRTPQTRHVRPAQPNRPVYPTPRPTPQRGG